MPQGEEVCYNERKKIWKEIAFLHLKYIGGYNGKFSYLVSEFLRKLYAKRSLYFLVSMLPLIELRGGLIIASLLKVPLVQANIICIIGNIIPIPFILLFIKKIFEFMKNTTL